MEKYRTTIFRIVLSREHIKCKYQRQLYSTLRTKVLYYRPGYQKYQNHFLPVDGWPIQSSGIAQVSPKRIAVAGPHVE